MLSPLKFFKKLVRILRGGSTIVEIGTAVTLGMLLGFLPWFSALSLCLILLLLLLNTPVHLAVLAFALGKVLSLPLAVVTYHIGRGVLAVGPLESLVRALVNAPVTAWMDLDRYCTLGGIVLGGALGVGLSLALRIPISKFRKKMASLEHDSEKFARFTSNFFVRFVMWLILGKASRKQKTYADVLATRTHLLRRSGVILVAIVLVLALGVEYVFAGYFARDMIIDQMERANGATVDIESLDLSLFGGKCTVKGLQVCDPDHLDRNLVSADTTEIDFSVGDLLSRRFVIETIAVDKAATDSPRETPGERLYEDEPLPEEPAPEEDTKSIYDYLEDAKLWKERIERLYRLYKRIAPEKTEEEKKAEEEEYLERLGYRALRATYLADKHPLVTIREIRVGGLTVKTGDVVLQLTLDGAEFSSDPALNEKAPTLGFKTDDGRFSGGITFGIATAEAPAVNVVNLTMKNISLKEAQKMLSPDNEVKFEDGTADIEIKDGKFSLSTIDIPVSVKLHDVKTDTFGGDSGGSGDWKKYLDVLKDNTETIIRISGSPFSPRIKFEVKAKKITSPLDVIPGLN